MRIIKAAALLASLCAPLLAKDAKQVRNFQNPPELVTTAPEASKEAKRESEGKKDFEFPKFGGTYSPKKFFRPKIAFEQKDMLFTFGGLFREEFLYAENPIMLNDSIPDGYDFFKQTLDLLFNFKYGKETFGHDAIELFMDIRQKGIWGDVGKAVKTAKENVKVSDSVVSGHSHLNTKPLLWLRDAWLKVSLNALLDGNDDHLHTVKIGWFPFYVGRGISLGTIYGASREFVGIYTGYQNDLDAPGINLHGDIFKDRLSYDLYFSRLEEKGASLSDTFNHVKSQLVGRASNPWRGEAKDNNLYVARLLAKAIKEDKHYGTLDLEPYVIYNEASDRNIEVTADGKSYLGTAGLALEWGHKNFEVGGEVAANFGHLRARALDRNVINIKRDDEGKLCEVYSHICDENGNKALVTKANKAIVRNSIVLDKDCDVESLNCQEIGGGLTNAANRFRPSFKSDYDGFMGVIDAAYTFDGADLKIATEFGYASGDENPLLDERDNSFNGFVGLQEAYSGKRVPSVYVLDARKLKRPLTSRFDDRDAMDDAAFSDIFYWGGGVTWYPIESNSDKFKINPNVLVYWKSDKSPKFDPCACDGAGAFTDEDASRHLGTEFNIRARYEMLDNLLLNVDFAMFFPGDFYDDVKGLPLPGDVFKRLDLPDGTGVDSAKFRLSNDTAWLINIGLTFKF